MDIHKNGSKERLEQISRKTNEMQDEWELKFQELMFIHREKLERIQDEFEKEKKQLEKEFDERLKTLNEKKQEGEKEIQNDFYEQMMICLRENTYVPMNNGEKPKETNLESFIPTCYVCLSDLRFGSHKTKRKLQCRIFSGLH